MAAVEKGGLAVELEDVLLAMFNEAAAELTIEDLAERERLIDAFAARDGELRSIPGSGCC